jgi:hypothetical protein
MSTVLNRQAGRAEGRRRRDDAHALLAARRGCLIRRARRAMITHLLDHSTVTADDVADSTSPDDPEIDPRLRGDVPGPLARAGIIRRIGYGQSSRPTRHASTISVWELADRDASLTWLARHPELPEPVDDTATDPTPIEPAAAIQQMTMM